MGWTDWLFGQAGTGAYNAVNAGATAAQSTDTTKRNLDPALSPWQFSYGNWSPQAESDRNRIQGYINDTRQQGAPQLAATQYNYQGIDPAQLQQAQAATNGANAAGLYQARVGLNLMNDQSGAGQQALANRLNSDMNGGQPSLAAQQLTAGQQANNRQALSLAASARGGAGNQVAALRAAMGANAAGNQALNQQQGQLRAQEYAQARGELGNVLGQQRQQNLGAQQSAADILGNARQGSLATANQQFGQGLQTGQFNAQQSQFDAGLQSHQADTQAQLEAGQRALAQQGTLGYLGQQAGISAQDMGGRTQYGQLMNNRDLAERGLTQKDTQESDQNFWQGLGTIGTVAAAASDERSKENVEPAFSYGEPGVDLRPAKGFSYDYKDPRAPGAAPGRHYGPMAQDLEKTPAGASTVINGPDGRKMVDTGRLALVNTAAISDIQRQLSGGRAVSSDKRGKTNIAPAFKYGERGVLAHMGAR